MLSIELSLIVTIAVMGLVVSLTTVRDAIVSEISDIAGATQDLNICYAFNGITGHSSSVCGSDYIDATDHCDAPEDSAGAADNCITFDGEPTNEDDGATSEEIVKYTNSDSTTDLSASQNSTTLKWQLEPGNEADADAVTAAIVDCIESGGVAVITWTGSGGETYTFKADTILADGPSSFGFSGSGSGSGSGKLSEATVECVDP